MTSLADFEVDALPEPLTGYDAWLREVKEGKVADADMNVPGDDDLTPRVEFWRGGKMVCSAICRDVNRDEGLQAAFIGVPGFGCDEVRFVTETHVSDERFFERYGRTPDPHELQHLCDNEGACELGLTTDALVVLRATREPRQVSQAMLPYHVNKAAKQVHWQSGMSFMQESLDDKQGWRLGGIVPDSLRSYFDHAGPMEAAAEHGFDLSAEAAGLSVEEARFHADMAILRILTLAGYGMMYATDTEDELAAVEESMRWVGMTIGRMDGSIVEAEGYEPDLVDLLGIAMRKKLETQRRVLHEDELREAARRRALRGEGPPPEPKTTQDVFDSMFGNGAPAKNRAERRAAARRSGR